MKLTENFNQQDFDTWVEDFLPEFDRNVRKVDVPASFSNVKSINSLGESPIGVRVYVIETDADPSRRKVGLATDSFTLLKNYGSPNAIIAYYSENASLWRISLLTSTPIWSEGRIITKLSNPKRQSYVLGSKAKVKTPHQYLISKGKVLDFNDLKSRFSLEVVNKEFYKEISLAFTQLVGGTVANGRSKKSYKALLKLPFLKDHSQTNLEFAVRLIGRIIFCWFLREKRSASGHSLMPKELVSFEASQTTEDYYHKILEPIFFEILNRPIKIRNESFVNELFSAIPYLNGGLFSPHEDDFFDYNVGKQAVNHNMVVVPDVWLKSLFEVLETYNFTIDENTSFDEELSIDPEMLGRIFENLLAEINPETGESARKSTGSYYTPRVIVDYMIDESLHLYLKENTSISEEKLRSLISYDLVDDTINPLNEDEKNKIAQALGTIKILDPACGSGAFPIGALQKIVFILQQIDPLGQLWFKRQIQNTPIELKKVLEREFQEKNFDYIRKLGIIRENIYGIDIQPIATEISRLRCFLTLVVDESIDDTLENRGIEPLPNLDFKFVSANTLVCLPKNYENQPELFDDNTKIEQLKSLRDQYFTARNEERKDVMLAFSDLQSEMINELIDKHNITGAAKAEVTRKLTDWKPFKHKSTDWFDPEWMFGIKEGFDLVIANPPYISYGLRGTQKMTAEERRILLSNFPDSAEYKISMYALFMDKAIQLSKVQNGIQTFIVPDSFLLGRYFSKIRAKILKNCIINHLSWLPYKIFEATVGYSVVYLFQSKLHVNDDNNMFIRHVHSNDQIAEKDYEQCIYPQSYFRSLEYNRFRLFFSISVKKLIEKIEINSKPLRDFIKFSSGLISNNGQKNIVSDSKRSELWKPGIISGGEINKYIVHPEGNYILYDKNRIKSGYESVDYFSPKLFVRQTGDSIICAFDDKGFLALNNVHIGNQIGGKLDLSVITAILNSSLMDWYYRTISLETGRTMAQTDIETIGGLPIKPITESDQIKISKLVQKIQTLKKQLADDDKANNELLITEQQLDELIYIAYKIDKDDIEIMEKND